MFWINTDLLSWVFDKKTPVIPQAWLFPTEQGGGQLFAEGTLPSAGDQALHCSSVQQPTLYLKHTARYVPSKKNKYFCP